MILVLDAYNILKQVLSTKFIDDRQRAQFLDELGHYAKMKGHKIVVVFDGGPYDRPFKERVSGVYVVYSGTQESADDYIRRYLEEQKAHDILLISSDRSVVSWAARLSIESIDSIDFYGLLKYELKNYASQHTSKNHNQLVKTTRRDMPDIDALMQEASETVQKKKEDNDRQERTSKSYSPSKQERKLGKKIKKL